MSHELRNFLKGTWSAPDKRLLRDTSTPRFVRYLRNTDTPVSLTLPLLFWPCQLPFRYICAASTADCRSVKPGSSGCDHAHCLQTQPGHAHAAQADEHRPLVARQRQRLEQRLKLVRGRRARAGAVADQGGGGRIGRRLRQVLQVEGVDAVRVRQRDAGLHDIRCRV